MEPTQENMYILGAFEDSKYLPNQLQELGSLHGSAL